MRKFKRGSRGREVQDIQTRLAKLGYKLGPTTVDGVYGEATVQAVKNFQQDRELEVDGIVGEETWRELVEATYSLGDRLLYLRSPFFHGDDVRELQKHLNKLGFFIGPVDGVFGPVTEKEVRDFQKNFGLAPDGIMGPSTLSAFHNLRRILEANTEVEIPEGVGREPLPTAIFKGRLFAIDCGHGYPPDYGAIGAAGVKESEVCEDLGKRFGNLLETLGAEVIYTRGEGTFATDAQRARLANKAKADVFVSFHLGSSSNSKSEGATCYYFAARGKAAGPGRKLAQSIQEELVGLLDQRDRGVKGKKLPVLKKTKMTAVVVEPLFITNRNGEQLVKQEVFRQKIAVAVFDGLKNFFE